MRRLLVLLVLALGSAGLARAADYAELQVIGFFAGGAVFAFEEYGMQDGSGFPYSNIYVIDTATDSWLPGTPIRVMGTEEDTVEEMRSAALLAATPILTPYGEPEQGRTVVSNPLTELSADPHHAEFRTRFYMAPGVPGHSLDITVFPLPAAEFCPLDFGYDYVGFELVLTLDTGETRILNHDTRIPSNRRCPTGYEIAEVIAYEQPGEMVLAILIDLLQLGFEGEDRRYLALTTRIAE
ncbi:MAG: DUF2259 domain-containing protein [Bauldia sp.]|nr:DUF2259 domain-containing protein [Bauldia sp.]